MADAPVDLSPFRSLVNFSAGDGHLVLAGEWGSPNNGLWHYSWIEFVEPAIGSFGLGPTFSSNRDLPAGESDIEERYGYLVISPSRGDETGTVHLVNLEKVLADHPDPERTHISFDFATKMGDYEEGKTLTLRSEVYRETPASVVGPYVADLPNDQEYLNSGAGLAQGFQYRRDGLVGMVGTAETTATVTQTAHRVRFNIPVGQSDDTPVIGAL